MIDINLFENLIFSNKLKTMLFLSLIVLGVVSAIQLGDQVKDVMIHFHNLERSEHCLNDLKWDQNLANQASDTAELCQLTNYGNNENYYGSLDQNFNPIRSLSEWLYEKKLWECGNFCHNQTQTQNYRKIMWNTTETFGCGLAECANNQLIWVVCKYDPPNNNDREPFPKELCNAKCRMPIIDTHRTGRDTQRPYTSDTYLTKIVGPNTTNIHVIDLPILNTSMTITTNLQESNEEELEPNEEVVKNNANGWKVACIILIIIIGSLAVIGILHFYLSHKNKVKSIV